MNEVNVGQIIDSFLTKLSLASTRADKAGVFLDFSSFLLLLNNDNFNKEFDIQLQLAKQEYPDFDYTKEAKDKRETKDFVKKVEAKIKESEEFEKSKLSESEKKEVFHDGVFKFCSKNGIPLSIDLFNSLKYHILKSEIQDREKFILVFFKITNKLKKLPNLCEDVPGMTLESSVADYAKFFIAHQADLRADSEDYDSLQKIFKSLILVKKGGPNALQKNI